MINKGFCKDFKWGVATAAYQIEGAPNEDGKGLSIWDMKCKRPGVIFENQVGDIACDHYHKYKEDIKIMHDLGIRNYRMSISWTRILPKGTGSVNQKGLQFYNNLIDELLKNNIEPFVTIFHWDYPQSLFEKGGWLNSESSNWFADYTKILMDSFSDKVKSWITLNEPQCFIHWGHNSTEHAPGIKLACPEVLLAAHNVLLSHGKAVQTIRSYSKQPATIGYAPVGELSVPFDEQRDKDIEVAKKETFSVKPLNCYNSSWWIDPVIFGKYPQEGLDAYGFAVPNFNDNDMKIISQPIDYLGLNIYFAKQVSMDDTGKTIEIPREPGHWFTPMGWPTEPKSLYWGPKFFQQRYNKPIMITENGTAIIDCVSQDKKIHDPQRVEYLRRYLTQLKKAANEGIDVRGYFLWSLMDNFEWAYGFSKRFGIVYTDFTTQQRIIKDSGYWYKNVIETNGKSL
ncbi:MAG: beta-glucosidase [Planctomycetes bacterium GWF2_41_51]|nr:MAG: beta-glucosidase [Planctomycetes bacterium GWF2_41_51]HBG28537.1 beta-glucosidase [Phycisphaerales bacterium]